MLLRLTSCLLAAAWMLTASTPAAAQPDSTALFRDANALARAGVYRTAIIRYQEAAALGLDTPLLHYNLGVVYYRLEQYESAVIELTLASQDQSLAALSFYNLGLTAKAQDDRVGAERWFALAEQRTDNRRLRALAQRGARSLVAPVDEEPERERLTRAEVARRGSPQQPVGKATLRVDLGYGQDDNLYRTPSAPYADRSQPGAPIIEPEIVSAPYVPVSILAQYVLHNEKGDTDFVFAYELDGDYYEHDFANADRVTQRFDIGANILLGENGNRRRSVSSSMFHREHYESNFNPDNGFDRTLFDEEVPRLDETYESVDLANRFAYQSSGLEGEFKHELGRWEWGFDMRLERREYERVEVVENYDQDDFFGTASVDYHLNDATTFSFDLHRYLRYYDDRSSRDEDGTLLIDSDIAYYVYNGVQIGVTRRFARAFEIQFDYLSLDRLDEYDAYYDYTKDLVRLRADYNPGGRFRLSLGMISTTYDYPFAFAYHERSAGPLERDSTRVELSAEFQMTPKWALWAQLATTDVTSTDARAEYSRTQTMFGAKWRR